MSNSKNPNNVTVFFSEKNIYGAWVVYGSNGLCHYYGMTKKEAEKSYRDNPLNRIFVNVKEGKNEC